MKITFTKFRDLDALSRTVRPGDTMESPADAPEELLRAYVNNGIATESKETIAAPIKLTPELQKIEGGN